MDTHTLELLEFGRIRTLLAEYAACTLGREKAEALTPSVDEPTVRKRLRCTGELADRVSRTLGPPMGGVHDIRPQLASARDGNLLAGEDLSRVSETLFACMRIRLWRDRLPALPEFPEIRSMLLGLGKFGDLADEIDRCVDGSGKVKSTAGERLARIRSDLELLKTKMSDTVRDYIERPNVKPYLQFAQATWSGDRFVLPVKAGNRGRIPGIVHRNSGSGETIFVEPSILVEMGNSVTELLDQEQQEVHRILRELTRKIALSADELERSVERLAELDMVHAAAKMALDYNCVEPEITTDGSVRLRQARHPVLLHVARRPPPTSPSAPPRPAEVVPIDVHLGDEFDLMVITGPNTGGKTAALKTVGLLALMAQSGLHIPTGHGARLPAFRQIYADIGDEQSLVQNLSTFSAHVRRQGDILRRAHKDTLVLLDELGAGTDPAEGAALGRAILDELIRLRCRAMVTTHLGALKTYAYTVDRAENASVEFDPQTLKPTYRLLIGEPGNSNALVVAERLGMNPGIIFRAKRYLAEQDTRLTKTVEEMRSRRRSAELARESALATEEQARKAKEEYERKLGEIDNKKRKEEDLETWRGKLQPGDKLWVPRFGSTGKFLRFVGDRKEAVVQVGYMEVRLPIAQLHPPETATA